MKRRRWFGGLAAALALGLCLGQGAAAAAPEEAPARGEFSVLLRVREEALLAGTPAAYRFRLERLDWESGKTLWTRWRTLRPEEGRLYPVDRDGYALLQTAFSGLPEGRYRLVEVGGGAYDFSRAGSLSPNALADRTAVCFTVGPGGQRRGGAAFTVGPQREPPAGRISL